MKKFTAIAAFLALVLSAGCGQKYSKTEVTFDDEFEKDEYAVYSLSIEYVYLRNLLSHNKEPIESIVIIAETNELGEYWENQFIGDLEGRDIPEEVIRDWKEANESTRPLLRKLDLSYEYHLVARSELDKYDADTFFSEFYKKYPDSNGLISVSRIGFNEARDAALIHVIHSYGTLGANYYFILLDKEDGGWGIVKRITTNL